MIETTFLEAQRVESESIRRTTPWLKALVFSVVDRVARAHYGDAYAVKCLQTSVAVQTLLKQLGISADLWVGAVCAAEMYRGSEELSWGGFWDKDHHVWAVTQFHEYADLNMGQLNRHPRSRRSDAVPIPAVWWSDIVEWPAVLKYLPDSRAGIGLVGADAADLESFLAKVDAAFDETLGNASLGDLAFGDILGGPGDMNLLYERGSEWVRRAIVFQEKSIPFPAWILEREAELIESYRTSTRAPSRIAPGTVPG